MKKLTQEEVIERFRNVHGDKYDYSQVSYIDAFTKVKVYCPKHGFFEIRPINHWRGAQCKKCAYELSSQKRKMPLKNFIEKSIAIHGRKYNYSKVVYINNNTKVCIICPLHGEFWQNAGSHLAGRGCPECGIDTISKKIKKEQDLFIKQARAIHGDKYDYSKSNYVNSNTPVDIVCNKHNYTFSQLPSNHLRGNGCPKCVGKKWDINDFLDKARKIHGDKYDYSVVKFNKITDIIEIGCPIHGFYKQTARNHLSGAGCLMCNRSLGEEKIAKYLNENNINFIQEYCIPNEDLFCSNIRMFVDFYLPDYNTFIEYQGSQHYISFKWFGGDDKLQKQQERDNAVRLYCKEHKIKLIEIPYTEFDNIEIILKKEIL